MGINSFRNKLIWYSCDCDTETWLSDDIVDLYAYENYQKFSKYRPNGR